MQSRSDSSVLRIVAALAVTILVGGGILFCFIQIDNTQQAATATQTLSNLKAISVAMHEYSERYGHLPPAYTLGPDGKPAHSWRVLLLEYLDQRELFAQYNFDEPWDGPNNRKLLDKMPACYRITRHPKNDKKFTSYVVLVGPQTAFPGATLVKLADIKDGLGSTIMIAESESFDIPWMEPRDWDVERFGIQIATDTEPGFSSFNRFGPALALADAIITRVSWKAPPEQLRALSTIAGGEKVDLKLVEGRD